MLCARSGSGSVDAAEQVFTGLGAAAKTKTKAKTKTRAKTKNHAQLRMASSVPADITAGGSVLPNGQAITVAGSLRGC
jgi:hypothetical protein